MRLKVPKLIRQIAVAAVGIPLLIVGIILIPAPGPGLLVCFLALLILSTEFEQVQPYRDKIKKEFKKITDKAKERSDQINKKR